MVDLTGSVVAVDSFIHECSQRAYSECEGAVSQNSRMHEAMVEPALQALACRFYNTILCHVVETPRCCCSRTNCEVHLKHAAQVLLPWV